MNKWQRVGLVLMLFAVFNRFAAGDVVTDLESIKFVIAIALFCVGAGLFVWPWE